MQNKYNDAIAMASGVGVGLGRLCSKMYMKMWWCYNNWEFKLLRKICLICKMSMINNC